MKRKNLITLTAIVLLFVMIALVMVCGTLAKYSTEYTGDGTAIVAKWNVKLKEGDNVITGNKTFNLFDESNVYDLAQVGNIDDLSGEDGVIDADVDVAKGDSDGTIVAPGTWGKIAFKVVISNKTEVSVKYGISINSNINDDNIPLQFSKDGKVWENDLSSLKLEETVPYSEIKSATGDLEKTCTLYWRWVFDQDSTTKYSNNSSDSKDTELAEKETTPKYIINATLGAEQVDNTDI